MDWLDVIEMIRRRRDELWEKQLAVGDEPEALAEAEYARRMVAEYESLLKEIQGNERTQLIQIASQNKILSRARDE